MLKPSRRQIQVNKSPLNLTPEESCMVQKLMETADDVYQYLRANDFNPTTTIALTPRLIILVIASLVGLLFFSSSIVYLCCIFELTDS